MGFVQTLNNYSGLINVFVVLILAAITYWYARSTKQMVNQMKKTRESSNKLMEKSITAQAEIHVLPKIIWEFTQDMENKKIFKIINKGASVSNCKLRFYIDDIEIIEDERKIRLLEIENNTDVDKLFSQIQKTHPIFTGYIDFSFISFLGGAYQFKYEFSGSWEGANVRITKGPILIESLTPWNI